MFRTVCKSRLCQQALKARHRNSGFAAFTFSVTSLAWLSIAAGAAEPTPASIPELAEAGFLVKQPYQAPPDTPPGAFGANRMLYTPPGTRRLAGEFSLPTEQSLGTEEFYKAPTYHSDAASPGYVIVDDGGKNTYKSKPTFYFGTEGENHKSDVGFQYEGLVNNNLPPGWSAFASVTLQSYKSRDPGAKESVSNWYQSTAPNNRMAQTAGTKIPLDMSLGINGQFFINTGPLPVPVKKIERYNEAEQRNEDFFYFPDLYPEHIYSTVQSSMKTDDLIFRRVIGMTQATGTVAVGTGAYLHNLAFNNGKRWLWGNDNAQDWVNGAHEYQPPQDNAGHTKTINGVESPVFFVDSVAPWHRFPDGSIRDVPDIAEDEPAPPPRYTKEGVNVDLLAPAGKILPGAGVVGTRRKKQ